MTALPQPALDGWVPDVAHDFGARLALVRQHHGWNIREAARECSIDPESWRHWEQLGRSPRNYQTVCENIADHSGCSAVWLMTGVVAVPSQRGAQVTGDKLLPFPWRRPVRHLRLVPAIERIAS